MALLLHTKAALESIEARMRRSTIRCEPPASSVLKLVSAHTRLLAISKPPSRAALKRAAALLESIGSATASMDGFYHALDCSGIPEIMKVRAFRRLGSADHLSVRRRLRRNQCFHARSRLRSTTRVFARRARGSCGGVWTAKDVCGTKKTFS